MFRASPKQRVRPCYVAALLALAYTLTIPLLSMAQPPDDTASFTLELNEKEMMLAHPGDLGMAMYSMWDVSYQRILDRNMPFVKLFNDEDSTVPITELRLTIGDERFNFSNSAAMFHGKYTMNGRSNPDAAISSHVEDQGDELIVDFGNGGLLPGNGVCFRINLDVDAGYPDIFPYPDYRTVLFDMNGIEVYDGGVPNESSDDNAMATVIYGTAGPPPLELGPYAFPDADVQAPQSFFLNGVVRPYGIMEHPDTFAVSAAISGVPEPSSIVLGVIGGLGGMMLGLRSRRRAKRGSAAVRQEEKSA